MLASSIGRTVADPLPSDDLPTDQQMKLRSLDR
jgi:hypothetical protein